MVIFAGKSNGYLNDIWKYVLGTNILSSQPRSFRFQLERDYWEEIKPSNAPLPEKRYGHSAVVKGSKMFVYGGFDSDSSYCVDLWAFSFGE